MVVATARELPLPAAITRGGRSGWMAALAAGVLLGAVTLIVPSLLSRDAAFGLLAILLGMIASVYLGYALADGRLRAFQIEYLGIVAFGAVATLALARGSALLLALGYLGHGLWDLLHHRRETEVRMPWWYVPLCLGYDTVAASTYSSASSAGGHRSGEGDVMSSRPAAPPPSGQLVDVGGYRLHLACQGDGSPTVVMEAAIGETGLLWSLVQPAVAQLTRACVYDRAGLGWSDPSPEPRTAAAMVDELHTLLSTAQVPGPYVLVGHSFGGLLVRLYAARYPQEVAGLVLVDSAHEDQYRRAPCEIRELVPQVVEQARQQFEGLKALIASGSLDPAVLPVPPQLPRPAADNFRALVAASSKHVDTVIAEQEAVEATHAELAAAQITSLGDLPLVVLSHGQPMAMPGLTDEVNQAYEQLRQDLQGELAGLSSRGRLVVAHDSGHYIQLERPQLVIDAIAEVVAAARTGSGDPAARASAAKEGLR